MASTLTVGSLFSGIGGLELGLERAGMRVKWQAEKNAFATSILEKHWPDVRRFGDVREIRGSDPSLRVDVLAGGYPCQDHSVAGGRLGHGGEASGEWAEFARIVGELGPRYVLVENVSGLLTSGFGRVLGDLAALGYDAEWDCLPASSVGAPHLRDRVFVVAYAHGERLEERDLPALSEGEDLDRRSHHAVMAHAPGPRCETRGGDRMGERVSEHSGAGDAPGSGGPRGGHWQAQPEVDRVANGVPRQVDRLRTLGNAVVPQVAEWLGRCIVEYDLRRQSRAESDPPITTLNESRRTLEKRSP